MLHRSYANQRSDYQFVSEQFKRLIKKKNQPKPKTLKVNQTIFPIIKEMFFNLNSIDYFKLHKLYYLIEYKYYKEFHQRLTNSYIVRQKDGPYCTDLHIQKIKKALPHLQIQQHKGHLTLNYSTSLFDSEHINGKTGEIIKQVITDYGNLTNEQIKTRVYLTEPMKTFLKLEKEGRLNLYNVPIPFDKITQ